MKNNKNSKYYVPTSIQKLFVGVISSIFIIQFLLSAYQVISQYQQNPNMSAFYSFFFTIMLVPLLLFITAYALNPRSLKFIERSFESILIAVSGITAWSLISMISSTIIIKWQPYYLESYAQYEIIASTLLVLIYGLVLYWLRSTKRWQ